MEKKFRNIFLLLRESNDWLEYSIPSIDQTRRIGPSIAQPTSRLPFRANCGSKTDWPLSESNLSSLIQISEHLPMHQTTLRHYESLSAATPQFSPLDSYKYFQPGSVPSFADPTHIHPRVHPFCFSSIPVNSSSAIRINQSSIQTARLNHPKSMMHWYIPHSHSPVLIHP